MFYKLDIPFNTQEEAIAALGDIKMVYVGKKEVGYINQNNNKKYRKYILTSKDIQKLSNISNALNGSCAYVVDTKQTYYLCNNSWY